MLINMLLYLFHVLPFAAEALHFLLEKSLPTAAGYDQKQCEYYDINEDTCTEIPPVNDKQKYHASSCLLNNKYIYLIGGDKYDQNNFLERYMIDGG